VATIKYSDLLDEVLPFLAADPSNPVTENAIKRAVIDFCCQSWVWKYLPDPQDVVAGEAFYDLEPDTGTEVSAVMDVACNGVPITNKSLEWLDRELPGWRTTRTTPKYFTQVDTEQIILAPVPDVNITSGLTMTLALEPSQSATGFPGWIWSRHIEDITAGALYRLMLMPGKPWTDLPNGADRRKQFEAAIASARASAVRGLSRAELRVTPHH
jgi:hypothetical protein